MHAFGYSVRDSDKRDALKQGMTRVYLHNWSVKDRLEAQSAVQS